MIRLFRGLLFDLYFPPHGGIFLCSYTENNRCKYMTNWAKQFTNLPSEELDALAVLRIIETTNGCIQFAFRDKTPDALSVEDTRTAMGFSMSSIKRMKIILENETIEFAEPTKDIMSLVRKYYISGMKQGSDEDYAEFMRASIACMKACGIPRLKEAKDKLFANCYAFPAYTYDWGLVYCCNLVLTNS